MVTFDRHRRLRSSAAMRDLVRETHLEKSDLIMPVFVDATISDKEEIASMPGIFRYSLNTILDEIKEIVDLGIQSIIIFGIPDHKDDVGSGAWEDDGIVQQAIRKIKAAYPDLIVIADTCMCEYTSTGHCGIVKDHKVLNDESLKYNTKVAVSQVKAGADMVAPSNAMDGFVAAIREGLDKAGYIETPIMAYSVKFASSFYGPFRDAADGAPQFGDRKGYQMDPANRLEAIREMKSDEAEGLILPWSSQRWRLLISFVMCVTTPICRSWPITFQANMRWLKRLPQMAGSMKNRSLTKCWWGLSVLVLI